MGIRTDRFRRQSLLYFTAALMLLALFTSRALLSISTILFLLLTCIHNRFPAQLSSFFRTPILVGMSLLFVVPLLSGLWSENGSEWWRFVRIKLPLLFFPLAFAGHWQLSALQWKRLAQWFLLLAVAGCCWSLWQYAVQPDVFNKGYLQAKVLPTPFENDHVRFSLAASIAALTGAWLFVKTTSVKMKTAYGAAILFFTVYLHILSARTGLLSLYLLLLMGIVYLLFKQRNKRVVAGIFAFVFLMPLLAWMLVPTFRNRIRYIVYDFSYLEKQVYLPGANDGNRALSIRAGWEVLKDHPWGVGTGDVFSATDAWYQEQVPGMLSTDKFYPSSEWLIYGATAGWAGVLLFTLAMMVPFFEKRCGDRFFWISLNTIAALSFLFDIGLEVQFGVFLYAFIVLWWWKWHCAEEKAP